MKTLQLLLATSLIATLMTSANTARAQSHVPDESEDDTVGFEQFCGGGWATSEIQLRSGATIKVDERKFETEAGADFAFDNVTATGAQVWGRSDTRDAEGDLLGQSAFVEDANGVKQIERNGRWLITRRSESLIALKWFVAYRTNAAGSRNAPPN